MYIHVKKYMSYSQFFLFIQDGMSVDEEEEEEDGVRFLNINISNC